MAIRFLLAQLLPVIVALWAIDWWFNGGEYARVFVRTLRQFGFL